MTLGCPERLFLPNGDILERIRNSITPGGMDYRDIARGKFVTIFGLLIEEVRDKFLLGSVRGNPDIGRVLVDLVRNRNLNGEARVGGYLLVGPLDFGNPSGPRARFAWPAYAKKVRKEGRVVELESGGTAGKIQVLGESRLYWTSSGHFADLARQGPYLRIGMRVSFEPDSRPYGLLATQVRFL